ncbi:Fc.00g084200.m01.CDS01 [Cosmosporella sp. VM-42]
MIPGALFRALTLAGLSAAGGIVLESNPSLPNGWEKLDNSPEPDHALRLSIALRQPDIDNLKTRAASTESFSSEGPSHLSQDEADALRVPDQEDVDGVLKWLRSNGMAAKATQDRDWVHVRTTVGAAEKLLNTDIEFYSFEDRKPVLRAREYIVPESVSDAISFIHPIANFMPARKDLTSLAPRPSRMMRRGDAPCAALTDPSCIRQLYNISYAAPDNKSPIRFGLAGFLEEYANYNDIHKWLNTTQPGISATGYNFSVELIHGGQNSQDTMLSGPEAALDVEYGMALGYPTDITYYVTGGRGPMLNDSGDPIPDEYADNEPYLEFLHYLLEKPDDEIPHVLSISYADNEVSVPRLYAKRVCSLFGLLTARGTTILSGTGDGGAKGSSNSTCRTNDGSNKDIAMAVFPASCPWVTAVGAVNNRQDPPIGAGFSGGGFSQYFPREAWQDAAVPKYVTALGDHLKGHYNSSMRALPDISAIGTQFSVIYAGKQGYLQGTSASTPVIAAMIALINDARVRRGKKVLGWINKLLYTNEVRAMLQDIVGGGSLPCQFQVEKDGDIAVGWPAAAGWDAITGLGVPHDFPKLLEVLVEA